MRHWQTDSDRNRPSNWRIAGRRDVSCRYSHNNNNNDITIISRRSIKNAAAAAADADADAARLWWYSCYEPGWCCEVIVVGPTNTILLLILISFWCSSWASPGSNSRDFLTQHPSLKTFLKFSVSASSSIQRRNKIFASGLFYILINVCLFCFYISVQPNDIFLLNNFIIYIEIMYLRGHFWK